VLAVCTLTLLARLVFAVVREPGIPVQEVAWTFVLMACGLAVWSALLVHGATVKAAAAAATDTRTRAVQYNCMPLALLLTTAALRLLLFPGLIQTALEEWGLSVSFLDKVPSLRLQESELDTLPYVVGSSLALTLFLPLVFSVRSATRVARVPSVDGSHSFAGSRWPAYRHWSPSCCRV
jgi:hypothetical protein